MQKGLRTTDLDDSTIVQSGVISRLVCISESACVYGSNRAEQQCYRL